MFFHNKIWQLAIAMPVCKKYNYVLRIVLPKNTIYLNDTKNDFVLIAKNVIY